jgi:hypothetical protein
MANRKNKTGKPPLEGFRPVTSLLPAPEAAITADQMAHIRDFFLVRAILFYEEFVNERGEYASRLIDPGSS